MIHVWPKSQGPSTVRMIPSDEHCERGGHEDPQTKPLGFVRDRDHAGGIVGPVCAKGQDLNGNAAAEPDDRGGDVEEEKPLVAVHGRVSKPVARTDAEQV